MSNLVLYTKYRHIFLIIKANKELLNKIYVLSYDKRDCGCRKLDSRRMLGPPSTRPTRDPSPTKSSGN